MQAFEADDKLRSKANNRIRRLISRAVEYIPRMQRTLAIQPIADIIAVKEGMKRFGKSMEPDRIIYRIPENHLTVTTSFTLTVTEHFTGQSVTLTGDNESLLRAKAIAQLTQLLSMSEALYNELNPPVPPVKAVHLKEDEINNEY